MISTIKWLYMYRVSEQFCFLIAYYFLSFKIRAVDDSVAGGRGKKWYFNKCVCTCRSTDFFPNVITTAEQFDRSFWENTACCFCILRSVCPGQSILFICVQIFHNIIWSTTTVWNRDWAVSMHFSYWHLRFWKKVTCELLGRIKVY